MAAPKRTLVIIAFAALYLIWGSTFLGIRFAIETIPPFLMAGARFLIAGVIMYAIAWSQGITKSSWANWRTSLIIGACLLLAGNGGVTISEQYIDSGLAALIVAIVPIYIVVLGWVAGIAPRPTPIVWLGLVGGFVGVGILLGPALHLSSNSGRHPAIGMSILLVSSFIWSDRSIRACQNTRPLRFSPLPNRCSAEDCFFCSLALRLASRDASIRIPCRSCRSRHLPIWSLSEL
jgi:drug/metabolite transporter (DMT)-like permease